MATDHVSVAVKQDYCKDCGEILAEFCRYLEARGRSEETQRIYLRVLHSYASHVVLLNPDRTSILLWIRARRQCLAATTLNIELTALRRFYVWAHQWGRCSQDLSHMIPRGKAVRGLRVPRTLTDAEIADLLAAPDITTWQGFRDHLMLRLLYETGMKASELISLEVGDPLPDHFLRLQGRRARYMPIAPETSGLIEAWLMLRQRARPGKSAVLFVTKDGRPFVSHRSAWSIVNRYAREALNIGRGFDRITDAGRSKPWQGHYSHLLRASLAARLLNRGVDILTLSALLGHQQASTTTQYIGLNINWLRLEHSKRFTPHSPDEVRPGN